MKAFKKPKREKIENPAFVNFTIKVDLKDYEDTIRKLITNMEGVIHNRMKDAAGTVNIAGYIDPPHFFKVLKKVKKGMTMLDWQCGECSTNLILTDPPKKAGGNDKGPEANYFYPGYYIGNGYGYVNGPGNGQWPGNGFGNGYVTSLGYAMDERDLAPIQVGCKGHAEDCDAHHGVPKEIIEPKEDSVQIPDENHPKCCLTM